MKTNLKELNLKELEMVNAGTTPPPPDEDTMELIVEIYEWISSWFD